MINPLFFGVRHGTTPNNGKNEYRGWDTGPDAQLNAAGRDVIREAAFYLQKLNIKFPMVISDSLPRTLESAKILADILHIPEQEIDERARTIDVGDLTGKNKDQYPLSEYFNNPDKRIPDGETVNEFRSRQAEFYGDVVDTVDQTGVPLLLILHGANASYLYNHFNHPINPISYEGLVNPGGVMMFTADGLTALTQKRSNGKSPYEQGTSASGFVTSIENRPPRECWNCKWSVRDVNDLYACTNPMVRYDAEIQDRKQTDGLISIGEYDCCDGFRNKIGS